MFAAQPEPAGRAHEGRRVNPDPGGFVYVVGSDPYASPKDGAKLTMVPEQASIEIAQLLYVPFEPTVSDGTLTFVWDAWFGPEWAQDRCGGHAGTQTQFKQFQVRAGAIYFESRAVLDAARDCSDAFIIDNRLYGGIDASTAESVVSPRDIGVVDNAPATPTGSGAEPPRSYPIKHGSWTRYIEHVRLNVPASDAVFDEWRSDCGGDGIPWHTINTSSGNPRNVSEFNFEYNTSAVANLRSGDLVSYHRNLVVLRDYDLALDGTDWVFQQPVP